MNWHDSGGAAFQIPHSNEPHAPCAEHGVTRARMRRMLALYKGAKQAGLVGG